MSQNISELMLEDLLEQDIIYPHDDELTVTRTWRVTEAFKPECVITNRHVYWFSVLNENSTLALNLQIALTYGNESLPLLDFIGSLRPKVASYGELEYFSGGNDSPLSAVMYSIIDKVPPLYL